MADITRPVSRLSTFISNGFGVLNIGEVILAYIVSVIVYVIPMLPMTLFAVSVSQLSRNSTSTIYRGSDTWVWF